MNTSKPITEYRIAKGWRILMYILAATSFGIGASMILYLSVESGTGIILPFFAMGGLLSIMLGIYLGYAAYKWLLVISENSITEFDVFKTRQLAFDDVKGYTINNTYISIIPIVSSKPTIILYSYIAHRKELEDWVTSNFYNLDAPTHQAAMHKIVTDTTYGATAEERLTKLEQARKVAQVLNTTGFIMAFWAFVYPTPYQFVCLACLFFPLISLLPYYYYRGLIQLDDTATQAYPNLAGALLITPMGLILRMLADFELIAYNNIWTPACVFAACFVALLYSNRKAANTKNKSGFIIVAFTTIVAIGYGYGACVFYNCYYDNSAPQQYHVKVVSKTHSSTIANNSYYLKTEPWGPVEKQDEYLVNAELYDDVSAGDTINLCMKEGRLHAPWVQITRQ